MVWLKRNILSLIIIVLFILYGLKTCNGGWGNSEQPKPDTVYTSHTEYIQQPPQIVPQYIPMPSSIQPAPIIIPSQYKPDTSMNVLMRQYMDILNKYLAKNNYIDSIVLKDSTGRRVGVVNLEDQISENKFIFRKPSYLLTFPVTTNTLTITNPAKKRNELYIGGIIEGSTKNVLNSAGMGLLFKSKKDAIWGLSAKYQFNQQSINYELSRYFKISFRNN